MNVCLNYLQDPNHLFKIAKSVSDRSRKEVEIVFKFGEQTQAKIKEINEVRKYPNFLFSRQKLISISIDSIFHPLSENIHIEKYTKISQLIYF